MIVVREEDMGERWCFQCRKRQQFTDRLHAPEAGCWSSPFWERTCPKGHVDGDLGFGRIRGFHEDV